MRKDVNCIVNDGQVNVMSNMQKTLLQFTTLVVCPMLCMDRIYIYMCVSVCVSVTPSVNSPTGQTPQRIFTVDSLKDADLRKDVPFGGLDDE